MGGAACGVGHTDAAARITDLLGTDRCLVLPIPMPVIQIDVTGLPIQIVFNASWIPTSDNGSMTSDARLRQWFAEEVLPLEASLTRYLHRNWRIKSDVTDLRQDVYEAVLNGARETLPTHTSAYVFTVARNLLINRAKRARVVSFEQMTEVEMMDPTADLLATERHLHARDALRRASQGLDALPPRCRQVVRLRKIEGLSTREAAERMGVGIDTIERQLVLGLRAMADAMLGGSGRIQRASTARKRYGER